MKGTIKSFTMGGDGSVTLVVRVPADLPPEPQWSADDRKRGAELAAHEEACAKARAAFDELAQAHYEAFKAGAASVEIGLVAVPAPAPVGPYAGTAPVTAAGVAAATAEVEKKKTK